jgi:hypothetical protein
MNRFFSFILGLPTSATGVAAQMAIAIVEPPHKRQHDEKIKVS